ncbi:DUF58 domain-containing protein [Calothrix sp. PCC 6303]|uniref:DUF58 domain-containing protein n=1 Tax=Calothrix sp. PCC 6303 TaxID=1170562 RepID=UPI0002A025E8|nr:DUF58 domain-containing protein [Calothrix sp. PCC 6303]AFZ04497.1 protein of unknown function DUF58 [Calothrix sp. PCC 6303]
MKLIKRLVNWLEIRACFPSYAGWVLIAICICFFGAAINTMAGWLYAISGISVALLVISAILPPRSLTNLKLKRRAILPVTAGEDLLVEIEVSNPGKQEVSLLQVTDILPLVLGKQVKTAIYAIASNNNHHWQYYYPTQRRGIYRWQTVELQSGAPLGLFWCRRPRECPATAIVYPEVLKLTNCPLVDAMGRDDSKQSDPSGSPWQAATEGLVRSLRPYRMGDPIRMVHWRTSARYGELRVRELEAVTGGKDVIIALDTAATWESENFEQAVTAAASLYFYAQHQAMNVRLWTAGTGIVKKQGSREQGAGENNQLQGYPLSSSNDTVLEILAATYPQEDAVTRELPRHPIIWLTPNPLTLKNLPSGSRWVLWQNSTTASQTTTINRDFPGMIIQADEVLQPQLQKTMM